MGPKVYIENYKDLQYFGSIQVGSEKQPMKVIFDSGSSVCWIPSTNCQDYQCTGNRFDFSKSTTFKNTTQYSFINFVTGKVDGYYGLDRVCVNNDTCTKDEYKVLLVDSANDLSALKADGVCGFKPPFGDQGTQLSTQLKRNNAIDMNAFTFHIGTDASNSWIDFGKPEAGMSYARTVPDPPLWIISILSTNLPDLTASNLAFDTGSSYILTNDADLQAIMTHILKTNKNCGIEKDTIIKCECN
jgi:hypothetical protein